MESFYRDRIFYINLKIGGLEYTIQSFIKERDNRRIIIDDYHKKIRDLEKEVSAVNYGINHMEERLRNYEGCQSADIDMRCSIREHIVTGYKVIIKYKGEICDHFRFIEEEEEKIMRLQLKIVETQERIKELLHISQHHNKKLKKISV